MQANLIKNLEKIFAEFSKLSIRSKQILKYGVCVFLVLFALGTLLVVINHSFLGFDSNFDLIATTVVRSSFIILAEIVIGALLMDYFFKKN